MATQLLMDKSISNAKSTDKPWTLKDGGGLFVLIHPNGSKYFQLRTSNNSKVVQSSIKTQQRPRS